MNVIIENQKLQKEATEVLAEHHIVTVLEEFGEVIFGGSFVYGTMVDRDIDIAVVAENNSINYHTRKKVADRLLTIKNLDGLAMTDRFNFPKKHAPKGIWFGPLIWHKKRKWNIDIWLVTQNEPYSHHNSPLHNKMLNITEEERQIILTIKAECLEKGLKSKGLTSSEVYTAVLDSHITNFEDFLKHSKARSK